VGPLLEITRELISRGHEVAFLTGARFAPRVEALGAQFLPLPPMADYDDSDLGRSFPRRPARPALATANFDIARLLGEPLPHQHRAMTLASRRYAPHVCLIDNTFLGGLVWRATDPVAAPTAVANITYLTLRGAGVPPPGPGLPPASGPGGAQRDRLVRALTDHLLTRPGQRHLYRRASASAGRPLPGLLFDGPLLADRILVLTVPGFEYPRVDLDPKVRFVGPVLPAPTDTFSPPAWWTDLAGGRPVVHVTQGTFANGDLGSLVAPTLDALAGEDVLVVATSGRPSAVNARPRGLTTPLPANARLASFIPYDRLLPHVDAMVTNGGYGGVQQALAHGLPLVVAGAGEDKPEIAARVAHTGAGINLRTGRPRPEALRQAVTAVLTDHRYRRQAVRLQTEMQGYDGARGAAEALEELAARRRTQPR
jgi:UDP:flavonoid glycosyltransferase YjiC (YdhE family)